MIRVLIVDDEPFIRQGLGLLIDWKKYGYMVTGEAANGKEAIELLENNSYDLIITDIKMPEVNGIELIEWVRKSNLKNIKIIVLSGYYEFEYAKKAIKYNVTDYILKPIQRDELINVLMEFEKSYEEAKMESIKATEKPDVLLNIPIKVLIKDIINKSGTEEKVHSLSKNKIKNYGIKKEDMDDLIQYTKENNTQKIDEHIEKICLGFKNPNMDTRMIDIYMNYLLCQLIHLAREFDSDIDQGEVLENINTMALEQFSSEGSIQHFKAFMNEFASYLNQLRNNVFGGVLDEIEKEIHLCYKENLSLKYLSEKYFINSAYLGQIFKKKYGTSFKDYLNNYRIERAMELLLRTNDKVYMIAEAVGYNNLDYFINKFVKVQGKTPLQYRKQFLKNIQGK